MPAPWLDRAGRFSPLKAATLAALFVPAALIAADIALGRYAARPLVSFQEATGHWTIRLLIVALAITPLRQALRLPRLILVRRMIGVGAFCYAVVHFAAYSYGKGFNPLVIAGEIVQFPPLPFGLATLTILLLLAATSTDAAVRRLGGRRWQGLHRLIYAAAALAIIHFVLEAKLQVDEAAIIAGLLAWLMGYRLVLWRYGVERAAAIPTLVLLSLGAGVLTMLGEAAYLQWRTHGSGLLVLRADFTFVAGVRPGWYVLAAGLALTLLALALRRRRPPVPAVGPAPRQA